MRESFDVVIVGGAVMGSSIAYHLAAEPAFDGRILVLEKDPSYARSASALSAGSIRQQFSTAINVAISLYGVGFLRDIGARLAVGADRPSIGLYEGGYLFLAGPEGRDILAANHALQTRMGADIVWHEPDELRARFSWIAVDGVSAGCWGRGGEGWFDGYALTQAFRAKARSLGVVYREAEAVGFEIANGRVEAVRLGDGSALAAGSTVVAAGTGAAELLAAAGVDLPVRPRKRMVFTFACRENLGPFPLLIDPSGVYVRPEGEFYICGSAPPPDRDPDATDFDVDHRFFEEAIWPVLARRVPAFETIKPGRAWAGHYDMNLFDRNAIVGAVGEPEGLYVANGFSGHGLQQAPAIGRGLAELIVRGRYVSLDLRPLAFARIAAGQPIAERNVV